MATLTLKKKRPAAGDTSAAPSERRGPLRSGGVRQRPTLAQAQADREAREAAYQARFRRDGEGGGERGPGGRPPRDDERRGGPRADERRGPPRGDDRRPPARGEDRGPARFHDDRAPRRGPADAPREDGRPAPRRDDRRADRRDAPYGEPGAERRARAPRRDEAPSRGPRRDEGAPRGPRREAAPAAAPRPPRRPAPVSAEDGERLSKRMTTLGLASRREADEWIEAGWVKVDGRVAVLGQRVAGDVRIDIDPRARDEQARRVTILLNKPIGYVSGQAEDGHEPASVLVTAANRWAEDPVKLPFHHGHARHLAPAGRLDIDSTGLLVLTQDGRIAKELIGEDSLIEKEYLVRVAYVGLAEDGSLARGPALSVLANEDGTVPEGPRAMGLLGERELKRLNHGLSLDGVKLKPAKVSWANEDQLRFVLREGRKRQVRRMCELVGLKVLALKRVRIGSVVLGKLPPGQWRYLAPTERF